jgi:lon-related putative ATP-dependent protease
VRPHALVFPAAASAAAAILLQMPSPLPASALRWRCDPARLPCDTTAECPPLQGIVGQDAAVEALRFGIECAASDQNVFVRGLTGTGRMSLVRRLLDELMPACRLESDHCYVHDFSAPDRPRLLVLAPCQGRALRKRVRELAKFVRESLGELLTGDSVDARRMALEAEAQEKVEALTSPFEADLRAAELTMVRTQQGSGVQTSLVPFFEGGPLSGQDLARLHGEGRIDDTKLARWREAQETFAKRFSEVSRQVQKIQHATARGVVRVIEDTAREILERLVEDIRDDFPGADVAAFLHGLVEDVVDNIGREHPPGTDPTRLYDVNVLLEHEGPRACPVIVENTPTLANLVGAVESGWSSNGPAPGDFQSVRAGSLLRANGGFLVLEARDVLAEPGAWRVLVRTLRTGRLEIVPQDLAIPYMRAVVKPEPIPIKVRVILVGDPWVFDLLDRGDPDFGHLFKVLADFDHEIPRDDEALVQYAGVLARLVREERLPHFDRTGLAALVEHGARIAAHKDKLTTRFARIADIAREAAYVATRRVKETLTSDAATLVTGDDVRETVRRTKSRADLSSRHFQAMIADRTIVIETSGAVVGQINGLAVIQTGMLTYGFPARITATIGPGTAGIIDIEGSASLSGQIHTKGFHILGGLLRHLLNTDHALAFSASLAFEQSYGGIDGDSASAAETCCLLSALTGIPLRQDIALTGAIDQHGRIQAIGGVNEKIEGFYDACAALGFTGAGGVIIPESNAGDLMLRHDVAQAAADGQFHVWPVKTVHEALELLTGHLIGALDADGEYPEGSLLGLARQRAFEFWGRTLAHPSAFLEEAAAGGSDDTTESVEPDESSDQPDIAAAH